MAKFRRYGKSRQLLVGAASALSDVLELDTARWAASGAPVDSIMLDRTLLTHLDADGDGRILAHEVREAISWTLATYSDWSGIDGALEELSAARLDPGGPDYEPLLRSLERLNSRLAKKAGATLTLGELREYAKALRSQPVSAAGIVLPEAADEGDLRGFIADAIRVTGGSPHPSGTLGIQVDQAAAFVAGIEAYLAWQDVKPTPFGESTDEVAGLVEELRGKLDQYFLLVKVRRMDPKLLENLGPAETDRPGSPRHDPARLEEILEDYPIAVPRADDVLALSEGVNPCCADHLARLFALAIAPRWPDSKGVLTEAKWQEISRSAEEYFTWSAAQPALSYDGLDPSLLEKYRSGEQLRMITALAQAAEEAEIGEDEIDLVEKAILLQAGILRVANNFVSFPQLYDDSSRAVFELGSLVMDGRYFHLALTVADRARHMKIAAMSNMYVLYVTVRERSGTTRYEVAVPVTAGTAGNLGVGKRGIFLDIHGQEYDAEVEAVIDNPVSLGEAIRAPFRRLTNALTARIESIGSSSEKQLTSSGGGGIFGNGNTAGLIAGGGVAVAALGSAAAFITGTLATLAWWKILVAVGAVASAIVLPAVLVAAVKLQRRDLSSILEATGWAINCRMRLTRSLSRFFTQQPGRRYKVPEILKTNGDASARLDRPLPQRAQSPRARNRQ